jgi:hypothetical protein
MFNWLKHDSQSKNRAAWNIATKNSLKHALGEDDHVRQQWVISCDASFGWLVLKPRLSWMMDKTPKCF